MGKATFLCFSALVIGLVALIIFAPGHASRASAVLQVTGGGLTAEYYKRANFTSHQITRTDAKVDSGLAIPQQVTVSDGWSVRWSGKLSAPASGAYYFKLVGTGAWRKANVEVNGLTACQIANQMSPNEGGQAVTPVALTVGQEVNIIVRSSSDGASTNELEWRKPGDANYSDIPSSQIQPAIISETPDHLQSSFDTGSAIIWNWTATNTPLGYLIYRGTTSGAVDYDKPLGDGQLVQATTFTNCPPVEGKTYFYGVKSVYDNPVTGDLTYSSPNVESEATIRTVGLDVVSTGRAKATLFWTAPSSTAGFDIYRSSKLGSLGMRITPISVYTPNKRADLTDSFLYSDKGLIVGRTYYYTVIAVNRRRAPLHKSDQVEFKTAASGFAWDSQDKVALMREVRNYFHANFPEEKNNEEFTMEGPDHVTYVRHADGSVEMLGPDHVDPDAGEMPDPRSLP
jgi:hypothetical protein